MRLISTARMCVFTENNRFSHSAASFIHLTNIKIPDPPRWMMQIFSPSGGTFLFLFPRFLESERGPEFAGSGPGPPSPFGRKPLPFAANRAAALLHKLRAGRQRSRMLMLATDAALSTGQNPGRQTHRVSIRPEWRPFVLRLRWRNFVCVTGENLSFVLIR